MGHAIRRLLRRLGISEEGVTAVEYAVLLALILLLCVAAVRTLGCNVDAVLSNAARSIGS